MSEDADPQLPLPGEDAEIAADVRLAAHVVVHAGTRVGAGCVIGEHVVLGRSPLLSPHSRAHGDLGALVLGERVRVGAGTVLFAGAHIASDVLIGEQAFVRERTTVGARTVIGRGSALDNDVRVGERARVQTGVYLTAGTIVEDDVFLGPGALTTNDDTMGRHPAGQALSAPVLRRACRIGGGAVLVPGVEIGAEAFVAAGAVVTRDVPPRARVMGVPARVVGEVGEEELLERWR